MEQAFICKFNTLIKDKDRYGFYNEDNFTDNLDKYIGR
jgi:hypothetical protein